MFSWIVQVYLSNLFCIYKPIQTSIRKFNTNYRSFHRFVLGRFLHHFFNRNSIHVHTKCMGTALQRGHHRPTNPSPSSPRTSLGAEARTSPHTFVWGNAIFQIFQINRCFSKRHCSNSNRFEIDPWRNSLLQKCAVLICSSRRGCVILKLSNVTAHDIWGRYFIYVCVQKCFFSYVFIFFAFDMLCKALCKTVAKRGQAAPRSISLLEQDWIRVKGGLWWCWRSVCFKSWKNRWVAFSRRVGRSNIKISDGKNSTNERVHVARCIYVNTYLYNLICPLIMIYL